MVAQPRQLQLGPTGGEQVVVIAGLAVGEQVVAMGQFALSPGAAIRSANPQATPGSP
jgi:hypothetical protein